MVFTPSTCNARISAFEPVILSFSIDINYQLSIVNYQLIYDSHATLVGTGDALGIGTQSLGDYAVALQRLLRTGCEFLVGEFHADAAAGDIDHDDVAILDLADIAAIGSLGRDMSDGETTGTA